MSVRADVPAVDEASALAGCYSLLLDSIHRARARRLTQAVERALELMRAGTRPPLANWQAAREFRLDVTQVARATGAIAADARLNRKARREAQERQP